MESIGHRILRLREEKEMKQKELADLAGITEASLSRYENNKRTPNGEVISRIATALEVTTDYLLGMEKPPSIFDEIPIPEPYTDKYKVTSRDKKQYLEHMKKATEAFFMNDEFDEEDKREILDAMTEIFWEAKARNKRKK